MGSINMTRDTAQSLIAEVDEAAKLNYGGLFFEPGGSTSLGLSADYLKRFVRGTPQRANGVEFLSPEYFKLYEAGVQEAKKQGLEVVLYDDYSFPSGTAGGLLYSKFPQYAAKSLNMTEQDVTGPKRDRSGDSGRHLYGLGPDESGHPRTGGRERAAAKPAISLPRCRRGTGRRWPSISSKVKRRSWTTSIPRRMTAYMSLTYDRYNRYLGKYFGNMITQTFYDEPSMHHANRMWTPDFNAAFQKRYGYSPMKYYPALWYDIGPNTAAARNALFGFRAALYEENYIKRLDDWCAEHHLQFGGHTDQEEPLNPTPLTGDLIKMFKYQTIPTIDDIWWYGRSNVSYKIVTSAAFNYDHDIIRAETYAAYAGLTDKIAFQVAMDQYAMGINSQVPARTVQPKRAELNDYVGRLSYMLQGRAARGGCRGALSHRLAPCGLSQCRRGAVPALPAKRLPMCRRRPMRARADVAPGADYQSIGEDLFRASRVDYTYLHPEVLVDNCTVDRGKLILNNK